MKKININVIVNEVVANNKKVEKNNSTSNIKKETTTLADMISADMLKNTKKYKDE